MSTENQRDSRCSLARLPGFEPGAFRLGGGPSIQLRYKRKFKILCILLNFAWILLEYVQSHFDGFLTEGRFWLDFD